MKAFYKPRVGDDIEVQWDGDEEYYLCTVFKAHRPNRLVVECHDDKGVYAFDLSIPPADGGWRWPKGGNARTPQPRA